MSPKPIIAAAITEIRGDMSDSDFSDALSEFTKGDFQPSPAAIQKYRTGRREPSSTDLSKILHYGQKCKRITPITAQRLANFFHLTELRKEFTQLQHELYALNTQLSETKAKETKTAEKTIEDNENPNTNESFILTENHQDVLNIPILVQIPGSYPLSFEEICEGYMSMPKNMLSGDNYFFLKIFGDSMKSAGINDGDIVLVRQTENAEDGQTVIARVKGQEYICRKYFQANRGVILLPADHDFEPLGKEDLTIIGIVEKVTRNL